MSLASSCAVSCNTALGHRLGASLGFHVYCLTKPCGPMFDIGERGQPKDLLGTAGALIILAGVLAAAAAAAARCCASRMPHRLVGGAGLVSCVLAIVLSSTASMRRFDVLSELGKAHAFADKAAMSMHRDCTTASIPRASRRKHAMRLDAPERACADPCGSLTHHPRHQHRQQRIFASPVTCLASRLSAMAKVTDQHGVALSQLGNGTELRAKRYPGAHKQIQSTSLSSGVILRLPAQAASRRHISGLCDAARSRARPVRLLIIGDSRARGLADGLIAVGLANDSSSQHEAAGQSLETLPPPWTSCNERAFRYKHNSYCGRAPPLTKSLCGGAIILQFKACWLFEQPCIDTIIRESNERAKPAPDLVIANTGLHDVVNRPLSADHRGYTARRLRTLMHALQQRGSHAIWLTTQPICCCKRWSAEMWRQTHLRHVTSDINEAIATWNSVAEQLSTAYGLGIIDATRLYGYCAWSFDETHFDYAGVTVGAVLVRIISSPLFVPTPQIGEAPQIGEV